jgi:outer membrane protein OmpA-like peptidoglycan-associated protein
VVEGPAGCSDKPEVRFNHWAWNAQMGMMLANGGKVAQKDSLMCKRGVNLVLVREDNTDQMQNQLVAFAEGVKRGESNPKDGAHFVAIMGDGSAQFLKGVDDRLGKLGSEYMAVVVGSAGYSRGEDKLMGPQTWRDNPQRAKGGVVAGVLRDGDWNIALKWMGDNKIANNPDEKIYDPDAVNWVNASDYVDAAQKYVSGYCADMKNVKTGKTEKHCVDAVVTWTPGDVTIAEQKGGLVSIVSTREYRSQMPNVIIGNKKWMSTHREITKGMLTAIFEAGDRVKTDDASLRQAAAVSAVVYKERDAAYWYRYFKVQKENDKQGIAVELGGSSVNNLADNAQLFGIAPGSVDAFGATYTVFGNVVKSQYPELMPSFYTVDQITDLSYVRELYAQAPKTNADNASFSTDAKIKQVVSKKAWDIQFQTGSATFTADTQKQLAQLQDDLVVAGGTMVEIHGHTDAAGSPDANMSLSEHRAFAVKNWLESHAPSSFPEGRVKVVAHGQNEPIAPNSTVDGRAKNRRVVIVLGTGDAI